MSCVVLYRASIIGKLFLGVVVVASVAGCAGTQEPPPASPESSEAAPPPPPALAPLPKGHVWRAQVMEVMSPGLGAFLQRVEVKEQLVEGQFAGFKILALRGEPGFWEGVDLQVGDVIKTVNGESIGHYDKAYDVWRSLVTAPEILVAYDRGQEQRELRILIHDEEEPGEAEGGGASPPPEVKAPAPAEPKAAPEAAPTQSAAPTPKAPESTKKK